MNICSISLQLFINYLKMDESQNYDEQSFSSNLSQTPHQHINLQRQIESNLISLHQKSHKRQIDHLYENICQKNLKPQAWLKKIKSDKNMMNRSQHDVSATPSQTKLKKRIPKSNKSFQQEIVLSNYKQLLRNHFQSQQEKDHNLHQLQKKCHEQRLLNAQILQQNHRLKKEVHRLSKQKLAQDEKVKNLSSDFKKLNRIYDNLLKESEVKQANINAQLKHLKQENCKYENLINALKDSIHILKGKKVKDLQQIWQQWKKIFQLASLQECKLSKNNVKN